MKKIFSLSALLCASLFSLTSCIEENFETPTPANDGDEIIFGARAGFEGSGTKTVYAGEAGYYQDENGKWFERIDWVDDVDAIQIYCTEAGGPNPSNYTVHHSAGHETENDFAYLSKIGESGLQWKGDGVHHFYAMYPSQALFENMETTLYQGIKMVGTTLHGIVPASQPATVTQNGKDWVAAPDMKYAYMAAKSTATKDDGSVSLSFVPIVTAVQIQMVLSSESKAPITIAEIQVSGSGIAGSFTADLSDTGWPSTQAYPTCSNVDAGNGIITISTWKDNKPVTVEAGGSLTFTVFLRPGADYSNLKVSYSPTGSAYVGKTIGNAADPVAIPRNLKTVFKGFNLPAAKYQEEVITIDASKWMSQLAGDTPMKKLSIPGTGGSFSNNYNSSNPGWYKQQTLTLDEQWKAGIRAFEIVSERPSDAGTSLGGEYVKCNKVSMNVTVLSVLQNLLSKVLTVPDGADGPTECAVLILTYQPEGSGRGRNASSYASSLKKMFDDDLTSAQKAQIIQYTPDLTLAQAKGKVMIFCRINQRDEQDGGTFSAASTTLAGTNITLIDGCGTGKDRWGSRGYKVNGNVAYDAANNEDSNRSVDYYLTQYDANDSWLATDLKWPDWNSVSKPIAANGDLNFGFSTNYSNVICWYQEWARVVDASIIDNSLGYYHVKNTGLGIADIYPDYRWYESYTEKLAAAEKTFEMAFSGQYGTYVFINSLCGYLVDSQISSSYTIFNGDNTGGIAGNIKALADKLNPAFYQYVLGAGLEQTPGPTGIVMMDYGTNTPNSSVEFDGSYLLPGVIISNNFKHGSGNGANTGGNTGGNNGGNNGGNTGGGDTETPEEEGGI